MNMFHLIIPLGVMLFCAASGLTETQVPQEKGTYATIDTSKGTMVVKLFDDKTPLTVNNFTGLAEGTKEWIDPKTGQKVKKPFYNGLIFHRVIKDFMIQSGCPLGNGTGGPGYAFEDECFEQGDVIKGKISDEGTAFMVWTKLVIPHLKKYKGKSPSKEINKLYQEVLSQNSGKPIMGKTMEFFQKETGDKTPIHKHGKLIHEVGYATICMANAGPDSNGSQFFIVTKKDGCSWLNGKHTVFGQVVKGMEVAHSIENVKRDKNDKPLENVVIKSIEIKRVK